MQLLSDESSRWGCSRRMMIIRRREELSKRTPPRNESGVVVLE